MEHIGIFSDKRKQEQKAFVEKIRRAFRKVREEMEDHLEAINQNTSDVQELHEVLTELEHKIDKLVERVDVIELAVNPKKSSFDDVRLTPREQEVFVVLYLSRGLTVKEISKRLGFTEDMVNMYLMNIIGKGVPIKRELQDDLLVFALDSDFKDLQARRNILSIDPRILKQLDNGY